MKTLTRRIAAGLCGFGLLPLGAYASVFDDAAFWFDGARSGENSRNLTAGDVPDVRKVGNANDPLNQSYDEGNEPSHHIPYLYPYAGRPDRTAERIRHLSRKFYRNAPDGLCGNEDHGEMSAWYLFACLGFYPVNPASGEFVLGAPQIPSATLTLADGKTFRIVARGLSEENLYVRSVMLNGRPLDGFLLRHADIARGGELVFEMASRAVFR